MNKFVLAIILAVILMSSSFESDAKTPNPETNSYAVINDKKIVLILADTYEARRQGLMNVKDLPENRGMLFLFPNSDYRVFWMKNMKLSLDILFIQENKIIMLYENIPVCKEDPCPCYESTYKADAVLELKAGFCKKYDIKPDDFVEFYIKKP